MMRNAYEQPDKQILQPIRDVLESQPTAFQNEIKETVKNAAELKDKLRQLLTQDEATSEKAITDLISAGLEGFPVHLQEDIKNGFQPPEPREGKDIIKMLWALERKQEARTNLYRTLGIAEPIVPAKKKRRWGWLTLGRGK